MLGRLGLPVKAGSGVSLKFFKVQTHMKIFLSQKARIFYKYKSVKDTLRPATPDQVWYKSYYFV